MPVPAPPVADERDGLLTYVRQQQDAFRAVSYGLTDEQAGQTHPPSTLTVGSLVKHAAGVQRAWLNLALAAPQPFVDPRPGEERMRAFQEEHQWLDGDSLEAALEAYDEVCAAVLDAIGRLDLDAPVPVPDAPWNPKDVEAWSVRYCWLHLVEELARHAGHADIIRESIDGATMYELIAGYEGRPETPWLKPWQPPQTG